MRKFLVPAAIALVLGSSGLAMAAGAAAPAVTPAPAAAVATPQSVSDTIKSFDLTKHTITLGNGKTYILPATFKDPGLKVGSKVTVKWQMKGTEYDATSVTLG
ncbi:hypothetical protein WH87_00555 [Devosia epidermidihirudinis]|uniref:DUF1344 domain-containing protein n=1 Tax=Devosia epidermidihirudinis TaxID=1293439 RepID=A0A0F5QKI2_9HYPH|nr:DUF1344 domain-containing protein [Devosia epidermidihirudinis]KKC41475.1 hypothetical protein WH87_00555 [Devosia epidermidihirudinis]